MAITKEPRAAVPMWYLMPSSRDLQKVQLFTFGKSSVGGGEGAGIHERENIGRVPCGGVAMSASELSARPALRSAAQTGMALPSDCGKRVSWLYDNALEPAE